MTNNTIEMSLGLMPVVQPNYQIDQMKNDINNDSALKDFEQARSNIVNIIDIGTKAVTQLGFLADTSQDPTHYEVLSKMIKDLSDTSEKLLKTHESYERILNKRNTKKDTKIAEGEGVSVYLSTSEIARAIKDLGK